MTHAAMGAAKTPPASMARTIPKSMPPPPIDASREPEATKATATSAVLTDPIAKRGASPRCSRNGVTTGPHAPTSPLVTPPTAAAAVVPFATNVVSVVGRRRRRCPAATATGG